jgi:hypothetical protein
LPPNNALPMLPLRISTNTCYNNHKNPLCFKCHKRWKCYHISCPLYVPITNPLTNIISHTNHQKTSNSMNLLFVPKKKLQTTQHLLIDKRKLRYIREKKQGEDYFSVYWEASHTKMQLQQEGENTNWKDQK